MPTTPRGYPLLTANQQYALVSDYNKLATKADAEATFTEARAQEVADVAKAYAEQVAAQTRTAAVNLSNEAKVIAGEALAAVRPVRDLVDSANTKADSALSTAEAAYAYNQALVAPAADIVNAVVTDPASEAGALVAGKAGRRDMVFNVRDFGAVGDGVTDDTAAIAAAVKAVETVNSPHVANTHPTLFFPPGNYRVSKSGWLSDLERNNQRGLSLRGAGWQSSVVTLTGTMGEEKWHYDNPVGTRNWDFMTITDMGFATDGVAPTAPGDPLPRGGFLRQWSSGHEKISKFFRCRFPGPWGTFQHLHGTANADQFSFVSCYVGATYDQLVYINNPQSVCHDWISCSVEYQYGHMFTLGPEGGGSVHLWGGSWIMMPRPGGGDTTKRWFFNMPNHPGGKGVGTGNTEWVVSAIRTEMRSPNSGFVTTPDTGQVHVTWSQCNLATTPGVTATGEMVSVGGRGTVRFSETSLPGRMTATVRGTDYATSTTNGGALLTFSDCIAHPDLPARVTVTGRGRAIGKGMSTHATSGAMQQAGRDFDIGWQNGPRGGPAPTAKIAILRPSNAFWPGTAESTEGVITLPPGALITRVVAHRPPGAGSAYDYTLHVGSDDKTVKLASSTTKPANQGTIIDTPVAADVGQEPKLQTVRMWADHEVYSVPAGGPAAWIEYI